jgi:hypothetical protein
MRCPFGDVRAVFAGIRIDVDPVSKEQPAAIHRITAHAARRRISAIRAEMYHPFSGHCHGNAC